MTLMPLDFSLSLSFLLSFLFVCVCDQFSSDMLTIVYIRFGAGSQLWSLSDQGPCCHWCRFLEKEGLGLKFYSFLWLNQIKRGVKFSSLEIEMGIYFTFEIVFLRFFRKFFTGDNVHLFKLKATFNVFFPKYYSVLSDLIQFFPSQYGVTRLNRKERCRGLEAQLAAGPCLFVTCCSSKPVAASN